MEKQIFKVRDKVYHFKYGWGKIIRSEGNAVIKVKFSDDTITFIDGKLLSFTEYTLQGFSQERPIELPEVGELCLVRDIDDDIWIARTFVSYNSSDHFPYTTEGGAGYKQMKRIKILD